MAARQDQGLQIGLIVSIFLFIICFVFAYVYWKSYSDSEQRVAELTTRVSGAEQAARTLTDEKGTVQSKMGFGPNDSFADVEKAVEEDMKLYAPAAEEGTRNYRQVLKTTYKELQDTAAREAQARQDIKELTNRLQAIEGETQKQIAQYKDAMDKSEADAAALRADFGKDRAALEAKQKELMATLEKQTAKHEEELAKRNAEVSDLGTKLAKMERAKTMLEEQRVDEPGSFEIADGRISWVNQNGTVWINLGEADALRRQITFSVFDGDQHDAAKATKKGSIEVTRILGEHLAEARVTEDDPRNPILSGDAIYSQVWHRGKKLRFALTGFIDIDGDGASDLELARNLIELNGGEVDSYLDENGQVHGEMTVNTRYLVLGQSPETSATANLQEGWHKMSEEADTNGVETITLHDFLNQMGYKPQDRTVRLGAGARAADFAPRAEDASLGTSGTSPSPFRPRTPYGRANGSRVSGTPY